MRGADRRGEAGFGAERIAAGDEGEIVQGRPRSSWVRSAIRSSNRQASPTRRTSASRATGFGEAKIAASTRSIHSRQRARRGQVGEFDVEVFLSAPWAAAGGSGHRP